MQRARRRLPRLEVGLNKLKRPATVNVSGQISAADIIDTKPRSEVGIFTDDFKMSRPVSVSNVNL